MNEYDSELIRAILTKSDYRMVAQEEDADIVMLNTCSIRENANRKVYGEIHSIRHRNPGRKVMIGILGCMATNFRHDLLENRNLNIDFIAGPDSYKKLPNLISEAAATGNKTFDVTLSEFETYSDIYPSRKEGINAWIAVMRGCNNFCTFCVVPYTRGRERSRSPENIVDEVKRLADDGFKQVTLLGQNVNSYRYNDADFAKLLDQVSKVGGIERIRFTSPHPKDFPRHLLDIVADNPKVCKQLHMPLQAGNNRILDLMNRTYTKEEFLDLIEETRSRIPDVALSTDIIIGFSTESDEEFEDTINVVKQVEFDFAFIFKYSERPGTIAVKKYPDDVPEEIKTRRIMQLNELQRSISLKKNQACIGQTFDILIEQEETPKSKDYFSGRTDSNKIVIIPKGPYVQGQFLKTKITGATVNALQGEAI